MSAPDPTPADALAARLHERCDLTEDQVREFYAITAPLAEDIAQEAVAERKAADRKRRLLAAATGLAAAFAIGFLVVSLVAAALVLATADVTP